MQAVAVMEDERLMDGILEGAPDDIFPPRVSEIWAENAAQRFERDGLTLDAECDLVVAAAAIAPGKMLRRVGRTFTMDINLFHVSSGHLSEFLLRESAKQQELTLTGTLLPCEACIIAKGVVLGFLAPVVDGIGGRWGGYLSLIHI